MLELPTHLAKDYKSPSQIARVTTEAWVDNHLLCPNCGSSIDRFPANRKSVDFCCSTCEEVFQLKSFSKSRPSRIPGGDYSTTLESIEEGSRPSFIFLHYDRDEMRVVDIHAVHSAFITKDQVKPRKPLGESARRAGWQGCYIHLAGIPDRAFVPIIRNGEHLPPSRVRELWDQASQIRKQDYESRAWISTILRLLDNLDKEFELAEVYEFENRLSIQYPENQHIRAKIRQQLQFLRDEGYIEFLGNGHYRKVENH